MGTLAAGYVQFANQRAGSHFASQWHDAWTCKCKCRPVPLGPLRRPQAASCIWRHTSPPDPAAAASAATCSVSEIMATAGPQVVPQKGFRVVAGVLLVLMLLEALGQIDLRLQFNVRGVATAAGDRDRFRARPLGWTLPNGGFRCVVQAMKMSKGGTAPRIDFAGASGNSSGSGGGGGEVAAEAAAGGACPPAPECPAADCHCEDCSADGVAAQKAAKAGDAMPSAEGGSSGGSGGGGGTALPAWQTSHQPALPARQIAKGIVSQGATGRARRAMGKLLRGEPISLAFVGGSITWCACMWAVLCEQRNCQPPLHSSYGAVAGYVAGTRCLHGWLRTSHSVHARMLQTGAEPAAPPSPAAHCRLLQGPGGRPGWEDRLCRLGAGLDQRNVSTPRPSPLKWRHPRGTQQVCWPAAGQQADPHISRRLKSA